jgi:RNA polymerase sigma-70 factor (ECF subfamily)
MEQERFKNEAFVHYKYFINVAKKMTQNEFDAQDLVQDTFMRAFVFFDTFRPGTNCKAWIYRIMKNLFINHSRKKTSHAQCSLDNSYIEVKADNEEPEINRYELLKLMEKIKDEYRIIIIMYHLEDLSLIEISKTLNWPLGTVKSRLHRARKEFKKVLSKSIN